MTACIQCLGVASLLLALCASPSPTHAAEPPSAVDAATTPADALRIEVDPRLDNATLLRGWVEDRNRDVANEIGSPEHAQLDRWISVQIAGSTYDYRVTITPMRDGLPAGPLPQSHACECNDESLLALIDEEIAKAVEVLRSTPTPNLPDPPRAEPEPAPAPASPSLPAPAARRTRPSPLGKAGVVVGAVGLTLLGGGIASLVAGEQQIYGRSKLDREFGPLGIGLLSTAGALLLGGVAMVVVDVVQCRKQSAPARCRVRSLRAFRGHTSSSIAVMERAPEAI